MSKQIKVILFLVLLNITLFLMTICIGRFEVELGMVIKSLEQLITGKNLDIPKDIYTVVVNIRLPRAVLGVLVGASLAVSGAAFQGLFHNPLVCSSILGISSGAGFGAALSIVIFSSTVLTPIFAFSFGILAVIMSYLVGRVYKSTTNITLVLGGTVVASIFSALLQLVKYVADPYEQLPAITFWMMGSLGATKNEDIIIYGIPMVVGIVGLFILSWRINILSMGDKEAKSLGIDVGLNRVLIIIFSTIATAGAVCVSGVVGWVGLVIPHIGRMINGTDNRILLPTSVLLGSAFMLIVDTICRTLTGAEIPLGIITAILGGPFFIYLLKSTKGANW